MGVVLDLTLLALRFVLWFRWLFLIGGIGGLAMAWITYDQGDEPKSVAISTVVASLVALAISRAALFLSVRAKY